MRGIVLAGGSGTRLTPISACVSKQLMPVYDKPMIYYPLATLMLAGIREVLLICTPRDVGVFEQLLGDGSQWGISLQYATQTEPRGLADAFNVGREFVRGEPCALVLGDNIFYGHGVTETLREAISMNRGATVFGYAVDTPERYGVLAFDEEGRVKDIVEKPETPPSRYAVTGLYVYDGSVAERVKELVPSERGELEITDLNRSYLNDEGLEAKLLGRGMAWLDTGTHDSLLEAGLFIQTLEKRQGLKVCCPEEIAYRMGYISSETLLQLAHQQAKSGYGGYLADIVNREVF